MVNAGGSSVFGQHVSLLTDQQCWDRMPEAVSGMDQPLPSWARAIAVHLPRTAAAMLKLDHAHRTLSPLDPQFRENFAGSSLTEISAITRDVTRSPTLAVPAHRPKRSITSRQVHNSGLTVSERLSISFRD